MNPHQYDGMDVATKCSYRGVWPFDGGRVRKVELSRIPRRKSGKHASDTSGRGYLRTSRLFFRRRHKCRLRSVHHGDFAPTRNKFECVGLVYRSYLWPGNLASSVIPFKTRCLTCQRQFWQVNMPKREHLVCFCSHIGLIFPYRHTSENKQRDRSR